MPNRVLIVVPNVLKDNLLDAFHHDADLLMAVEVGYVDEIEKAIVACCNRAQPAPTQRQAMANWLAYIETIESLGEFEPTPVYM